MELAPGIVVNGVKITPDVINAEVQYYPAETYFDAKYQTMQALVIKELLLQEAAHQGTDVSTAVDNPDIVIDALLERELDIPSTDEETCKRYYEQNLRRFMTSPLYQVSHILYLAPPEDEKAYAQAKIKAEDALARIQQKPDLFKLIAKKESACSSSGEGGNLGQISKGQTLPAFEAALMAMKAGDMSAEPLASEVGYHIIKVHEFAEGKQLPYDAVAEWIADFLEQQSWKVALNQYIQVLAGKADISGFDLKASRSPLVQ